MPRIGKSGYTYPLPQVTRLRSFLLNRYAILERSGPNKAPTTRRDRGHAPNTIKVSSTDMDSVEASRQSTAQNILGNSTMGDRFGLENGDVNLIPEAELIFDPLGDTAVMNQGLGDLSMLDWSIPEQTDLLSPNSLGSSVYNHPSTDAIPGFNNNFWGNPREGFMSNLIGDRLYDQISPLPHLESPTVSDMNKSITASTTRRESDIFCNDEDEEGEENDDSEVSHSFEMLKQSNLLTTIRMKMKRMQIQAVRSTYRKQRFWKHQGALQLPRRQAIQMEFVTVLETTLWSCNT